MGGSLFPPLKVGAHPLCFGGGWMRPRPPWGAGGRGAPILGCRFGGFFGFPPLPASGAGRRPRLRLSSFLGGSGGGILASQLCGTPILAGIWGGGPSQSSAMRGGHPQAMGRDPSRSRTGRGTSGFVSASPTLRTRRCHPLSGHHRGVGYPHLILGSFLGRFSLIFPLLCNDGRKLFLVGRI